MLGCSPLIVLFLLFLLVLSIEGGGGFMRGVPAEDAAISAPLPRIDAKAGTADLLPAAPQAGRAPVYVGDDLASVPEVMLEDSRAASAEEWRRRKAYNAAAALHLNGQKRDGFLEALLAARADLAGLPFAMGDDCRTTGERAGAFKQAAEAVRGDKGAGLLSKLPGPDAGEEKRQQFYQANLAVIRQVMPAEEAPHQDSLVHALAAVPSPEATRELARVAVYSADEAARAEAVRALSVRREEGSTEVLLAGLSYPWPAVADHAASAIVKLKRKDLAGEVKRLLAAPDPRGPRAEVKNGREETVAYELVRVNHLRNCQLCHAPAERGKTPEETLVAEIPVPAESLPDNRSGYGQTESNLLVRLDVTYLRQDFSAMQDVRDWTAGSWPARQRFDYLLRRRVLSPAEAADLRERLAADTPYRRVARRVLDGLRGRAPAAAPDRRQPIAGSWRRGKLL
jgi:hypothetical protein